MRVERRDAASYSHWGCRASGSLRLVAVGQLSIANDCCLPKQSLRQSFHGDLLQSSKLSPAYDPFRMATLHLLKWCYRSGAVLLYRGFSCRRAVGHLAWTAMRAFDPLRSCSSL